MLFQTWDTRHYGKIKVVHLVENLLSLGIQPSQELAISMFQRFILKTLRYQARKNGDMNSDQLHMQRKFSLAEVGHVEIELVEFLSLLNGGEYQ